MVITNLIEERNHDIIQCYKSANLNLPKNVIFPFSKIEGLICALICKEFGFFGKILHKEIEIDPISKARKQLEKLFTYKQLEAIKKEHSVVSCDYSYDQIPKNIDNARNDYRGNECSIIKDSFDRVYDHFYWLRMYIDIDLHSLIKVRKVVEWQFNCCDDIYWKWSIRNACIGHYLTNQLSYLKLLMKLKEIPLDQMDILAGLFSVEYSYRNYWWAFEDLIII